VSEKYHKTSPEQKQNDRKQYPNLCSKENPEEKILKNSQVKSFFEKKTIREEKKLNKIMKVELSY